MSGKHILLVEDDQALARMYGKILAYYGFTVEYASTVKETLAILKEHSPDIVCLDWQLGHETSRPILEYLSLAPQLPQPAVMIVSGGEVYTEIAAFSSLIQVYLQKPLLGKELVRHAARLSLPTAIR